MPRMVSNTPIEYPDRYQPHHEHVERADAAMHQHLVDHHLEEQRRDQREDLQEEGRDHHFAKEPTVFVDGAKEPGDVEVAREVEQSGSAGHEDEPAVPDRLEFGPRHERGSRRRRRLHEHLVFARFGEEEKSAVLERGYRRQRSVGEARPRTRCRACLEPELFPQSQHFGNADGGAAEAMANLLGVGADAVEAHQRHQHDQSGIGRVQICGLCQHQPLRYNQLSPCCSGRGDYAALLLRWL
jgi:hypothetical protein